MGDREREERKEHTGGYLGLSMNLKKKEKVVRKEINVWMFWNLIAFL